MICENYRWLTEIYVAHRGLFDNDTVPENSLPAFEKAAAMGFGIETDVQASKDGVLMIFHDDTLDRMTGVHGKLCDFSFEELRRLKLGNTECKIPTFQEFLQAAKGVNLVVEIKTHKNIGDTEKKVVDALKNYSGNYCIESFNPFIVRWFKVHAPHIVRGQLATVNYGNALTPLKRRLLSHLSLCKWNGSQFIAFDAEYLRGNRYVEKFAKKIPIICWTVKSQRQHDQLCDCFDNMIFDSFVPQRKDLQALGK